MICFLLSALCFLLLNKQKIPSRRDGILITVPLTGNPATGTRQLFLSAFFLGSFTFGGCSGTSGGSSAGSRSSGSTFSRSGGSGSSGFFMKFRSPGNFNDSDRRVFRIQEVEAIHFHVADLDGVVEIQFADVDVDVIRHVFGIAIHFQGRAFAHQRASFGDTGSFTNQPDGDAHLYFSVLG